MDLDSMRNCYCNVVIEWLSESKLCRLYKWFNTCCWGKSPGFEFTCRDITCCVQPTHRPIGCWKVDVMLSGENDSKFANPLADHQGTVDRTAIRGSTPARMARISRHSLLPVLSDSIESERRMSTLLFCSRELRALQHDVSDRGWSFEASFPLQKRSAARHW